MKTVTIQKYLADGGGSTGFDYLRAGLAIAVVLWHSFPLSYGQAAHDAALNSPVRAVVSLILFMFFALSGFLVAGSLDRNRLPAFLSLRALRIFPALAVEVTLSAIVLGSLLTTAPLQAYFTDPLFFRYMLNAIGLISFELPGVFQGNPYPAIVNGSLWTVPYELECYIALAVLTAVGIVRRPKLLLLLCLAVALAFTCYALLLPKPQHISSGRSLVFSFMTGVLIHVWRAHIPLSRGLAVAALILALVMLQRSETFFLVCFPISYLTVFIGLQDWPRPKIMQKGDYSYGIYLFAFPIQQMVASWPPLQAWWLNFPIALLLCCAYAAFSWHVIEEPLMRRKRSVVKFVNDMHNHVEQRLRSFGGKPAPEKTG